MRVNWTKKQAIKHFGSITAMAKALGTSTQAVSALQSKLTRKKQDEIVGASIRLGLVKVQEVES
jgi:hypothetical protein